MPTVSATIETDEGVSTSNEGGLSPLPPNSDGFHSGIDSGHQELPPAAEIYTSLTSADPQLASDLSLLCHNCQKSCLHHYYYNYMCSDGSIGSMSDDMEDSNGSRRSTSIGGKKIRNIKIGRYSYCRACRDLATITAHSTSSFVTPGFLPFSSSPLDIHKKHKGFIEKTPQTTNSIPRGHTQKVQHQEATHPAQKYNQKVSRPGSTFSTITTMQTNTNSNPGTTVSSNVRKRNGMPDNFANLSHGQCQVLWDSQSKNTGGYIQTMV